MSDCAFVVDAVVACFECNIIFFYQFHFLHRRHCHCFGFPASQRWQQINMQKTITWLMRLHNCTRIETKLKRKKRFADVMKIGNRFHSLTRLTQVHEETEMFSAMAIINLSQMKYFRWKFEKVHTKWNWAFVELIEPIAKTCHVQGRCCETISLKISESFNFWRWRRRRWRRKSLTRMKLVFTRSDLVSDTKSNDKSEMNYHFRYRFLCQNGRN